MSAILILNIGSSLCVVDSTSLGFFGVGCTIPGMGLPGISDLFETSRVKDEFFTLLAGFRVGMEPKSINFRDRKSIEDEFELFGNTGSSFGVIISGSGSSFEFTFSSDVVGKGKISSQ